MASFRAYLFGIARNVLLMHLRSQGVREDKAPLLAPMPQTDVSPSHVLHAKGEQKLLSRALRTLPLDMQIALEMHYWENLKSREIADVLGVTTSAVTTRLSRARGALRESIEALAADDPHLVTSTLVNLESWARSLARS